MTAEEWMEKGHDALALGELEAAADCYRKATELAPDSFDAWHALGMVCMKLERYPEAIEAGLRAIEISPNDQMGYTSLSLAYVRNGQIKEAEEMGAKARILSWGGKIKKETPGASSSS